MIRFWRVFVGIGMLIALLAYLVYSVMGTQDCVGNGADDYGDAPDGLPTGYPLPASQVGAFPSSSGAGGVTATVLCSFWLGETVTGEDDYVDANDPDPITPNAIPPGTNVPNSTTDYDDGVGWEWRPAPGSGPSMMPADLVITLEINSQSGGPVVVNILQDHNVDGDWSMDSPGASPGGEWVVINHLINAQPGLSRHNLAGIRFPAPMMVGGMVDCFWMRVVITNSEVFSGPGGWDGSGTWPEGEVEDFLVHAPSGGACARPPAGSL